jgi:hypothetical protein
MKQEVHVNLAFILEADAAISTDELEILLYDWALSLEKVPVNIDGVRMHMLKDFEIEEEAEIYGPDDEE